MDDCTLFEIHITLVNPAVQLSPLYSFTHISLGELS